MNSSITQNHLTNSYEEETCQFAMQLASASILPMALKVATELDLLGIISRAGPGATLTPLEIASHLPTQNPEAHMVLDRILRVLASHSVLNCSHLTHDDGQVQRLYGLEPVCKYFFVEDGLSMVPLLHLLQDKVVMESWYHLKDAVVEGGTPFHNVHGMTLFEYTEMDPRFRKLFSSAMFNYTTITMTKILETYKGFEGLKELVDVGGGEGFTLNMIISKYPAIKGINFDLPHIIAHAPSYPGVKHIGGDMFATVPKGEAIFMKWILHCWSDEYCLKALKNCYQALPDHGKVVAVDLIIPAAPDTSVGTKGIFQIDMVMMIQCSGGKERTEKEFEALAKGAGFAGVKVVCCAYNFGVMEFYKSM